MYLWNYTKKIMLEREFRSLLNELRFKISTRQWKRKNEGFNNYYTNRQWEQAIKIGEKTVQVGEADAVLYQKMANSYLKINKESKGKQHMKKALQLKTKMSKKEVVDIIETSIFTNAFPLQSHFTYLGGSDNLGFVKHIKERDLEASKYLTKIVPTYYPLDHFANKEKYFHKQIRHRSDTLKQIVPQMTNYIEIKNKQLLFMTFPLLANDGMNRLNIQELIHINEKIGSSIEYNEIIEILKVTDKGKALERSALMHRRSTHLIIFRNMRGKIHGLPYEEELNHQVSRFEQIIVGLRLYDEIKPTEDYVFCHGDFNENNILYDEKEHKYQVIDWSSYGLALRGFDLAKLFASKRIPFAEITEEYMDQIFKTGGKNMLDKVFFVYMLFIYWIGRLDLDNIEKQVTQSIMPAGDYIEKLIEQSDYYI